MSQQSSRAAVDAANARRIPSRSAAALGLLDGVDPPVGQPAREADGCDDWVGRVRAALGQRSPDALTVAEQGLRHCPTDPEMLLLSALAALAVGSPERALSLLKRYGKRYVPGRPVTLLTSLAMAQQGNLTGAWQTLHAARLDTDRAAIAWFVGDAIMDDWLCAQLHDIRRHRPRPPAKSVAGPLSIAAGRAKPASASAALARAAVSDTRERQALPAAANLPRLEARFDVSVELANVDAIAIAGTDADADPIPFRLRGELVRLSLFEGFDELLCLQALQGVEAHWYQIETVRKVLKQYRGRVLLADEVGLGKTVEAGMILKEYMLRGMAERILILTPASLVGQWRDEMAAKFGIDCATSHDPLLRGDPARFWAQPRVIASIATARRKEHADVLTSLAYDVVVVDEAHHLRDQASASYRLVNSLQKRFLLLLSATPVQNSLLELYNLLTLLQPGIFKTQKEFRAVYMVPGKPREPVNRERLRDLMRGVMVRNTRALAALRMPRRHASTLRTVPTAAEADCYAELTTLVRALAATSQASGGGAVIGHHRLSVQHLLAAAGSSPAACAAALARAAERDPDDPRWTALLASARAVGTGAKETALLRLLAQNPAEKKLVFVQNRDSLAHLANRLRGLNMPFVMFSGDMTGPQKDAAVEAFRDRVPLLLCTESGGEGRNLQFCSTLINFDIPWNPMAIEQRIGRIDRIGQTREVFIFNLVTAGTIEDAMLRLLDEKINMFELVVGEVAAILGEVDEQQEFSSLVLDAWLHGSEPAREAAFARLEGQLVAARRDYDGVKQLDEALFGNDLDAA